MMKPIGILAGGGGLPEQIAGILQAQGRAVHIVGLLGEAEVGIARYPHTWANWGAIGRMMAAFRNAGCKELVIVGSVTRPDLRKVRPDLGLIRAIPTILQLFGGGDDHVLRNIVRFFELQGFTVRGVYDVTPELVMATGAIGAVQPSTAHASDIAAGFALIDALGSADIGQAVVISNGRVLAIEAAEGTDRMLQRLQSRGAGLTRGGVLIKRPKPGQELRVDLPAIGPRTIHWCVALGLSGIAVQAGKVLVVDRSVLIEKANADGLFVTGVVPSPSTSVAPRIAAVPVTLCGRLMPDKRVRADIARAVGVMRVLSGTTNAGGIAVVRRHVIAIETGEGLPAMLARVEELRQWGATARSKRRGVVALAAHAVTSDLIEGLVEAIAVTGLACIVLPVDCPADARSIAARAATGRGLVIVEAAT